MKTTGHRSTIYPAEQFFPDHGRPPAVGILPGELFQWNDNISKHSPIYFTGSDRWVKKNGGRLWAEILTTFQPGVFYDVVGSANVFYPISGYSYPRLYLSSVLKAISRYAEANPDLYLRPPVEFYRRYLQRKPGLEFRINPNCLIPVCST